MNSEKKPQFRTLYEKIITAEGMCSGCGACIVICPNNRLVPLNFLPEQVYGEKGICPINEEGKCGLCAQVCPRLNRDETSCDPDGYYEESRLQVAGYATDERISMKCQDGGVASALLQSILDSGQASGVLGYTHDEKWGVHPQFIKSCDEVSVIAGSKYTYTSVIDGLNKVAESNTDSATFVLVGLPCQIDAVRNLQKLKSKYVKNLYLSIGLFCTKAFSYQKLIEEKFSGEMGFCIEDVVKMDIGKDAFTVEMKNGTVHRLPLKELKEAGHPGCAGCCDFSAEKADISLGSAGVKNRTIALIRTEKGEKTFQTAVEHGFIQQESIEIYQEAPQLINRLSKMKRTRACKIIKGN